MPVLVDTNVLLDVLEDDPRWGEWSQGQLETAALTEHLAINAVIYSALSMAFERIEELDDLLVRVRVGVVAAVRMLVGELDVKPGLVG